MLNKVLLSIVRDLSEHSIPYMVVGGYAVLYHAQARFTEDIDIVLGVDIDQFEKVLEIVSGSFEPRPENPREFVRQTNVLPLLEKEHEVRVDLIFSFLEFERNAIDRSVTTDIRNQKVHIVKPEDLIVYKILAGRARDLDDIRSILNSKADKLNVEQIASNIRELSTALGNDLLIQAWEEIYSEYSG